MNALQLFQYEGMPVRTVQRDNETWWIIKDICEVLDIANSRDVFNRLEDDEKGVDSIDTLGGRQSMQIVNESGLYSIILRSDKPQAKPFRKWVTGEVLPTIRRTGGYVSNDDLFINTYLPHAHEQTQQLFRLSLQYTRTLNAKIERDAPKVLFADAVTASKNAILIGELAKLLKQNGIPNMGQNRLFGWLRDHGYLIQRGGTDYNMPTQKSMEKGLFEVKEHCITHNDGSTTTTRTTKVTGKGQLFFINYFLKESGQP